MKRFRNFHMICIMAFALMSLFKFSGGLGIMSASASNCQYLTTCTLGANFCDNDGDENTPSCGNASNSCGSYTCS